MDRRSFMTLGVGGSLVLSMAKFKPGSRYALPLVISTWDNRKANKAAMMALRSELPHLMP